MTIAGGKVNVMTENKPLAIMIAIEKLQKIRAHVSRLLSCRKGRFPGGIAIATCIADRMSDKPAKQNRSRTEVIRR
jgi:hypothetical protein